MSEGHSAGKSRGSSRSHINRACEPCRHRKTKCNGKQPCQGCHSATQCIYRGGNARKNRKSLNTSILPSLVTRATPAENIVASPIREFSALVQFKQHQALRVGIGVSNPATGSFQFYGPSSHFCFIQRIYERVKRNSHNFPSSERGPVPDGIEKWGIERFMFSVGANEDNELPQSKEAYFPKDMGIAFIRAYFAIMHPQMPVLSYTEVMDIWDRLWEPPRREKCTLRGKELLYMVLAIGARVSNAKCPQSAELIDLWAEHFSNRADDCKAMFQEPSLKGIHFMLLKAMYALQVMRPNEAYLYFGYAVRSVLALGINRSQVTDGNNLSMHRLRLTFWTIFANEKMSALFIGRPSSLCEDQVDTAYPGDILLSCPEVEGGKYSEPTSACAWVRAMSGVGKIADKVSIGTYSPTSMRQVSDVTRSEQILIECDAALTSLAQSLPSFLHFFDENLSVGESWQEVQRISLGLNYYLTQMLMHRPTLIFATFFGSTEEAEKNAAGLLKIQDSVEASTSAAKNLIDLAHNVYFKRYPDIRFDGSLATFLASACITLLYDVLDPRTATQHAKSIFTTVERGIQCLDEIEHIGPLTGKAISMDIMKVAKDALISTGHSFGSDNHLVDSFPWLQNDPSHVPLGPSADRLNSEFLATSDELDQPLLGPYESDIFSSGPRVNYMPHSLDHGFDISHIPDSLF